MTLSSKAAAWQGPVGDCLHRPASANIPRVEKGKER
jgi:hypothetical protein